MSYKNRDWLFDNYIVDKRSTITMGKMCDISYRTILRWIHRFDIPLRLRSGWKPSNNTREKMSMSRRILLSDIRNHPNFGKHLSEETRRKISERLKGIPLSEETKKKISKSLMGNKYCLGNVLSQEHRNKISESERGSKHWNWQNGKSFEPYCPKFNKELKERIRNRDGRICMICHKSEMDNGEKLCVHHIDGDKMQGCGKKWYLVSLCRSCHMKLHNGESVVDNFEIFIEFGD